jgi:hypothetical protein
MRCAVNSPHHHKSLMKGSQRGRRNSARCQGRYSRNRWLRRGRTHRAAQGARSSRRRHTRCLSQGRRGSRLEFHGLGPEAARRSAARPSEAPRFRRAAVAGRRNQPGQTADDPCRRGVREGVLRRRQAGGSDLPWPVDDRRGRQGTRPAHDLLAIRQDRSEERRAEAFDEEAVVDGNMVTSRSPDDIPVFNREAIKLFAAARGQRRAA